MKKLVMVFIILVYSHTAFAGGLFYPDAKVKINGLLVKTYDYNKILVTKVVDGDTLHLENGDRVRLIGIDTPESKVNTKLRRDSKRIGKDYETITAMGKKAAKFTTAMVNDKYVRLEFDVQKRDRYNRLLAYIYLPDGKMLNAEIIKAGYAQVMTVPPNVKYQ
ncbi:MAG: thermonuclease family protein, partial [Candidatus Omnitrophota bacterium]|nr:thermonuclease family protein [Candidatus Omnitrophota bacterium]